MTINRPPETAKSDTSDIESGTAFLPQFDENGLIPAIVSDSKTGEVLMFAFMNAEALDLTVSTGLAHFYSRSRRRLWKKGEESGNLLAVSHIKTDCDQDVLWLSVQVEGNGVACHTGARSCFYRQVTRDTLSGEVSLVRID